MADGLGVLVAPGVAVACGVLVAVGAGLEPLAACADTSATTTSVPAAKPLTAALSLTSRPFPSALTTT